jgi:hypothetical protein
MGKDACQSNLSGYEIINLALKKNICNLLINNGKKNNN